MRYVVVYKLTLGMALLLLAAGCRQRGSEGNLRDRILAANPSQYCLPDACFNPNVLAVEDGYYVTTFAGAKPQNRHVSPKELAKYLQTLPYKPGHAAHPLRSLQVML